MSDSPTLLIVGASARAAAMSAIRAGYRPVAADLFGDDDLNGTCPTTRLERYPFGLSDWMSSAPRAPWIYVGALENYPALVDQLAHQRTLYGNAATVLHRLRDPRKMSCAYQSARLACPEVRLSPAGIPVDGSWLQKPISSGGGAGIIPYHGEDTSGGPCYFQRRIDGLTCSAVYVAARGTSTFLGASQQLVGSPRTGAETFTYCGSLASLRLTTEQQEVFVRLGNAVAEQFGLRGLFGIDAILTGTDVWPVELNPRYTSSVELLERATGIPVIDQHVAACRDGRLPDRPKPYGDRCYGKAILFAERDLSVDTKLHARFRAAVNRGGWPELADIPPRGTQIPQHRPVITVFAEGADHDELSAELWRRTDEIRSWLYA